MEMMFEVDWQDCTEREIKAVDSEHKKNILSDQWVGHVATTWQSVVY